MRVGVDILKKLLLIFFLPVVIILLNMYEHTDEKLIAYKEAGDVKKAAFVVTRVSAIAHEIQKERGIAIAFMAGNKNFYNPLILQRKKVDEEINGFLDVLKEADLIKEKSSFEENLRDLLFGIASVDTLRKQIDNKQISSYEAFVAFSNINDIFLKNITLFLKKLKHDEFIKKLSAHASFSFYKETVGLERASAMAIISKEKDVKFHKAFSDAVSKQESYLKSFYILANEDLLEYYQNEMQIEQDDAMRLRDDIFKIIDGKRVKVDPMIWFNSVSKKMDLLKEIQDYQSQKLLDSAYKITKETMRELIFMVISIGLAIIFSLFLGYMILRQMQNLNKTLQDKVDESVRVINEQNRHIIEQARVASMGEMIGNIAHQWRQPLTTLALMIQKIELAHQMDKLDAQTIEKTVEKSMKLISFMSKTIDDFRNFFKPNKETVDFSLKESILGSLSILESMLLSHNIKVVTKTDEDIFVNGYPSEFSQVVINIINNAKDAFLENKIENPQIDIELLSEFDYGVIRIRDNANGIPDNIINRIFDPYFSTKEEGKGVGIGLHMSMMIIKEHMKGSLKAKNIEDKATGKKGAEFEIRLKKVD